MQGGLKINTPFIAPGDALYLQGAYGERRAALHRLLLVQRLLLAERRDHPGPEVQPVLQRRDGQPVHRSAGAVRELHGRRPRTCTTGRRSGARPSSARTASRASRAAPGSPRARPSRSSTRTTSFGANAVGTPGTRFYNLSQALRDTYQFVAGASLIWSPVKDLDIGVEGYYTQIGVKNGRVIDKDKGPTAYGERRGINAGSFVRDHDARTASLVPLPRPARLLSRTEP